MSRSSCETTTGLICIPVNIETSSSARKFSGLAIATTSVWPLEIATGTAPIRRAAVNETSSVTSESSVMSSRLRCSRPNRFAIAIAS